jgi:glycosyltransferase involved in cell wall biosynthesis
VYAIDNMRLGGTELNAVRTAERLDRDRFAVSIICLKDEGPLSARYRDAGIPVEHLGLTSYSTPRSLGTFAGITRSLRRARADIIHCQDIYSNVFIGACAHAAGARVVLSQRWARDLPPPRYRWLNDLAYRFADMIVLNSPSHGQELARLMPGVAARLLVLPGFADDTAFAPVSSTERVALRRSMGIPPDGLVIGMIARLSPVKNHTTLLRAFAQVSGSHPGVSLVFLGDGPARPALEAECAALGITSRTYFLGEQTAPFNLHALFDLSVLPSLSEGFPNSIVEAMAAGKAVAASAIEGVRDAVLEGRTALLAAPTDVRGLTANLQRLLSDQELRESLGRRGQQVATTNFRAGPVVEQLQGAYESVAAGGRPGPGWRLEDSSVRPDANEEAVKLNNA